MTHVDNVLTNVCCETAAKLSRQAHTFYSMSARGKENEAIKTLKLIIETASETLSKLTAADYQDREDEYIEPGCE